MVIVIELKIDAKCNINISFFGFNITIVNSYF